MVDAQILSRCSHRRLTFQREEQAEVVPVQLEGVVDDRVVHVAQTRQHLEPRQVKQAVGQSIFVDVGLTDGCDDQ